MVHCYLLYAVADTARHAQFGAGSHGDTPLETIHLFLPNLETVSLLFPITVGVEDDMAVSFFLFWLNNDGWGFAETPEDFNHPTFVLWWGRFCKGEFGDVFGLGLVAENVRESIVVLYPSIDPIEKSDDLICIKIDPS